MYMIYWWQLEASGVEISDKLYDTYGKLFSEPQQPETLCFKTYVIVSIFFTLIDIFN